MDLNKSNEKGSLLYGTVLYCRCMAGIGTLLLVLLPWCGLEYKIFDVLTKVPYCTRTLNIGRCRGPDRRISLSKQTGNTGDTVR